eukprot:6180476-Pleurochrysis_carterae.AAC.3
MHAHACAAPKHACAPAQAHEDVPMQTPATTCTHIRVRAHVRKDASALPRMRVRADTRGSPLSSEFHVPQPHTVSHARASHSFTCNSLTDRWFQSSLFRTVKRVLFLSKRERRDLRNAKHTLG